MENQSELDLEKVGGVESESVDLNKFDKKETTIGQVEVIQVPSHYVDSGNQWVLKIASVVLETLEHDDGNIDFRASELFNLVQDKKGKLTGFPKGEGSNLMKFVKDLKIDVKNITNLKQLVEEIKGKTVLIKSYEKEVEGKGTRTYLKFRY